MPILQICHREKKIIINAIKKMDKNIHNKSLVIYVNEEQKHLIFVNERKLTKTSMRIFIYIHPLRNTEITMIYSDINVLNS